MGFFFLTSLILLPTLSLGSTSSDNSRVSIVLLGSTGDLAKRYLWPAIFQHFLEKECLPEPTLSSSPSSFFSPKCRMLVVGGYRKPLNGNNSSNDVWREQVWSGIHCKTASCEICLQKFIRSSLRMKISQEDDYKILSNTLNEVNKRQNCTEVGRVFYLSVPPSAYGGIVQYIHLHASPESNAWLRVVLEKPFGSDLSSAKLLARDLEKYLKEDEVYRVDHYLGKQGVKQILPFRIANLARLQFLWNKEHIQHVKISMKERLDVKGRSSFFDKYGILRDVHQNHLTEILARLLMDVSILNGNNFLKEKNHFLVGLNSPSLQNSILGQYSGYHDHLVQDGTWNQDTTSSTPTFATVTLFSRISKWTRIPLLLTAGKQLDERKAFASVVFKQLNFSLLEDGGPPCPAEIVFLIQDEELGTPGVLLSHHFHGMGLEYGSLDSKLEAIRIGSCPYKFLTPLDEVSGNAYVSLVGDILSGKKENFVDIESLLNAWRVWDPLLQEIESIQPNPTLFQYSPNNLTNLDFHMEGTKLVPVMSPLIMNITGTGFEPAFSVGDPCIIVLNTVPGFQSVVTNQYQLADCLAKEIKTSASASVARKGVFHLALPGGHSIRTLLIAFSLNYASLLPWKHTHIWQTDERCVGLNDTDSNWNQLDDLLLSQISIPYHQLHPMPIALQNGFCIPDDNGSVLYEQWLEEQIGKEGLDHIVLGVGHDGHIASLFPTLSTFSMDSPEWVQIINSQTSTIKNRMTLTYRAILSARAISVLIIGRRKEKIVNMMKNDRKEDSNIPIMILLRNVRKDQLTLYIGT